MLFLSGYKNVEQYIAREDIYTHAHTQNLNHLITTKSLQEHYFPPMRISPKFSFEKKMERNFTFIKLSKNAWAK